MSENAETDAEETNADGAAEDTTGDGATADDAADAPEAVIDAGVGAGGGRMREFVESEILARFGDGSARVGLGALEDGSVHSVEGDIVLTTDTHVVDPPVFPGGDIGELAISGTVNDLAMMGATDPIALTCGLIVEAGTPESLVTDVLDSMAAAADRVGVEISTGDTKVMGAGEIDRIAINTTGIGRVTGEPLQAARLEAGDRIVVSGPIGEHGLAVLSAREGFDFGGDLASDVAPVNDLVRAAMAAGTVRTATDPTRGGLAMALNEFASSADAGIAVEERAIPISEAASAAGEVLGIEPLDVANEGVAVFGVAPDDADAVVDALREAGAPDATIVGEVLTDHPGRVVLDTGIGRRYLAEPTGEQLPRIC
ncbi:hydrogenase expression/formation protein HypE [Halococcoides cellulosivorans]|uniref:Hydrogenase expression/formation protein HypE n=1 Tax=Halococcoides cellulosivorans TaxID=1679096 RepID=A0A2R4WXQ8_9EURY|nr:hydrogenase expression/formation protein HypE [Halococcoides cellulosivorans]AWB26325.1 hydrogenase expression/formation protein HypE [Halococcoides cellulosivorans]